MRAEHLVRAKGDGPDQAPGFSLLEVLVALLILSLALIAVVRAASLEARALSQVRASTFAQWVAANAIAELRLNESLPEPGRREGRSQLGGQRWRWVIQVRSTESPRLRRLETEVFSDTGDLIRTADPVARLDGFIGR